MKSRKHYFASYSLILSLVSGFAVAADSNCPISKNGAYLKMYCNQAYLFDPGVFYDENGRKTIAPQDSLCIYEGSSADTLLITTPEYVREYDFKKNSNDYTYEFSYDYGTVKSLAGFKDNIVIYRNTLDVEPGIDAKRDFFEVRSDFSDGGTVGEKVKREYVYGQCYEI